MTKLTKLALLILVVLLSSLPAAGAQPAGPVGLGGAMWIWAPVEGTPPAMRCYLRGKLELPKDAKITAAELTITADNLYKLYINGTYVGQGDAKPDNWRQARRFVIGKLLRPGDNAIAVEAVNTAPGPAGLILRLSANLANGEQVKFATNPDWLVTDKLVDGWHRKDFDDTHWWQVKVLGEYGSGPWGKFVQRYAALAVWQAGATKPTKLAIPPAKVRKGRALPPVVFAEPDANFTWPGSLVFLGEDCTLYRGIGRPVPSYGSLGVTIFVTRNSRSFPEHDLCAPIKMGRKLYALTPTAKGAKPRLLLDAGQGAIGSPSVSFDGRSVLVSMAPEGDAFFHLYRVPADGGKPVQLTRGCFHDIDPVELPDGRIVFTSTRTGTFEEYHNPPSRGLFSMKPDGTDIRMVTPTFVFDNEPEVMADGRIVFLRSDNFFGRGKVEVRLQASFPDGTDGYTEFGIDNGPEYGNRLRPLYIGSPAPMPDGRLAYVSSAGIAVGLPGAPNVREYRMTAGDVAATPDGRLLCTIGRRAEFTLNLGGKPVQQNMLNYDRIAVLDPETGKLVLLYDAAGKALHSPVYLGARPKPPVLAAKALEASSQTDPAATGRLFCQDARITRNTTAGWKHVKAIRVLGSRGLTTRSSHAYIVHSGTEVVELGTVPLAPDGSFMVDVPADMGIAFQAVDAEGRSELNEMSWIFVRPGETRSCIGCHHKRQAVPAAGAKVAQAMRADPLRALGQGSANRFRGNNAAVTGLMNLQADRYRETAGLNLHADTMAPLATSRDEAATFAEMLRSGDADERTAAAQRLGLLRHLGGASALTRALRDENREVRVAAAVALAACGTRESTTPLLDALADEDPLVALAAAMALENLTGHAEANFNPFASPAARAEQVKAWQAWMKNTAWAAIERKLIERLTSGDRDEARRAAVALGHTGSSDDVRKALRAYVAAEASKNPFPEWRKRYRGDGARFNSLSVANQRHLQEAVRALGRLRDEASVGLLARAIADNSDSKKGNLFLAEAAAEALGEIATPAAQEALVTSLKGLQDYFYYTGWYGDHSALFACHACPVHYFIAAGLDEAGSTRAREIVPHLIRSVPTDPDRALMPRTDDCETLAGRVIRRQGAEAVVTETCLAILGDAKATSDAEIDKAVRTTYKAWAGKPDPENRAAHTLSLVCRDPSYAPRIAAALERYRNKPVRKDLIRAFGGGGLPKATPVKHWVCFYLARELGNLCDSRRPTSPEGPAARQAAVDALLAVLEQCPPEAASGRPAADDPAVIFLHNDLTPCYRAAAAWALGRIGDRRAAPTLLKIVADFANAPDTRHAAAEALGRIADPASLAKVRDMADDYPEFATRRALLEAVGAEGK